MKVIFLGIGALILYLIAIIANYEYFKNEGKENERKRISKTGHENK